MPKKLKKKCCNSRPRCDRCPVKAGRKAKKRKKGH
jgi:hypothetical protein